MQNYEENVQLPTLIGRRVARRSQVRKCFRIVLQKKKKKKEEKKGKEKREETLPI